MRNAKYFMSMRYLLVIDSTFAVLKKAKNDLVITTPFSFIASTNYAWTCLGRCAILKVPMEIKM